MELPFLKKRTIMADAGPSMPKLEEKDDDLGDTALHSAADAMIVAVHGHDYKKLASALKDAHTILGARNDIEEEYETGTA